MSGQWWIRNQTDFASGLMFTLVGAASAIGATNYAMGTSARAGPGYYPFWVGTILAFLGVIILLKSLLPGTSREPLEAWKFGPLAIILAAAAAFAALLPNWGLVVASTALVGISCTASHEFNWRATLISIIVLSVMSCVIFIYLLGLPMSVLPPFVTA